MPKTKVVIYQELNGQSPFIDWLRSLSENEQNKIIAKVRRLEECGFDLRRPEADYLDKGIYELRARAGRKNLRALYGFVGKNISLLSHGCTKEGKVPATEIKLAASRLASFQQDPDLHTYKG